MAESQSDTVVVEEMTDLEVVTENLTVASIIHAELVSELRSDSVDQSQLSSLIDATTDLTKRLSAYVEYATQLEK